MNNGLTQKFSSLSKLEYLVAFMSVIVDLKSYKVSFLIFHYIQKRTAKILFHLFQVVSTQVEVFFYNIYNFLLNIYGGRISVSVLVAIRFQYQ